MLGKKYKAKTNCSPITHNLNRDFFWMGQAIELAGQAGEKGEVPVAAMLIRENTLIAAAHNLREQHGNPIAHAEMLAIQAAAEEIGNWRFVDTTLYVTLEPCSMCAGAIVLARIPRVVYATTDPKSGAAGTLYNILQDERLNHRVELVSGVLAEESSALLKSFFQQRRRK
ncbi:tRNA-specific adenosine deaminase [Candidatus Poribacteria bacterium]|nr:MAG: tRNA-specific adenosine deaminase [Candidatus Poribacteria bacterium]